jgi:hypothetical protein
MEALCNYHWPGNVHEAPKAQAEGSHRNSELCRCAEGAS